MDRTPSQFFSGTNITIAIPGQVSGGSVVEKPVGVSLSVTPTFVDDDTLLLSVKAGRTDFEKGEPGTFDQSLNTTRNYVIASALVKLDQTLILSGLFSSDLSTGKSGAPVLRDIPGLQYFFAAGSTHEFRKSILITLTPRRPAAGLSPTNASASRDEPLDPLVAKIRDRLNRDIVTAPNVLAVIRRLAGSNYVQQFRSGDLQEQDWRSERSLDRLLLELEHFLYF